MLPYLPNLLINEVTGEIFFNSRLDASAISNFDRYLFNISTKHETINFFFLRISITVQVLQYHVYDSYTLYLGSLTTTAVIFYKTILSIPSKAPYFLRNYYSIVNRENVFQNIPLLKPIAISSNGNNQRFISYYLLNNSNLFRIDTQQGFIYPLKSLSLPINIYSLQVQSQKYNLSEIQNFILLIGNGN